MEIEKNEQVVVVSLMEQLKNHFVNPSGIYPEKLIENIIQNRELTMPRLIQNLDNFSKESPRDMPNEQWLEGVASMFILSKLRETAAFPYLIKLCMMPHHTAKYFISDVTTESMAPFLASTFNGDFKSLDSIVVNQHLYEYIRGAALNAYIVLYKENKISRRRIISAFSYFFDELYDDFSYVPSALVSGCCNIRAIEFADKIEKYFKEDVIETMFVDRDEVEESFSMTEKESWERLQSEYYHGFVSDLRKDMEWLFRKEEENEVANSSEEDDHDKKCFYDSSEPFVATGVRIGRNSRCPCNSGKKYKKCCGAL